MELLQSRLIKLEALFHSQPNRDAVKYFTRYIIQSLSSLGRDRNSLCNQLDDDNQENYKEANSDDNQIGKAKR